MDDEKYPVPHVFARRYQAIGFNSFTFFGGVVGLVTTVVVKRTTDHPVLTTIGFCLVVMSLAVIILALIALASMPYYGPGVMYKAATRTNPLERFLVWWIYEGEWGPARHLPQLLLAAVGLFLFATF